MTRRREVGTLWIGGSLSWMEQLCLKSFVDKGQKITLFSYEDIPNVPEGVIRRDGREVLIVSSGLMTMRALEAAKDLQKDGVDVAVLHVPTIKPLDEATILAECGKGNRLVVVAENHTVIGGLGEAVAGTLMRSNVRPAAFRQIGLPDAFLEAGALPTLHDMYGISVDGVAQQIKGWL